MRKTISLLLILLGLCLLLVAGGFVLHNQKEAAAAGDSAQAALQSLQAQIPTEGPAEDTGEASEETTIPAELPEKIINGRSYIGYLSIPDLQLELPVLSQWSYPSLRIAPCRQRGTVADGDLVIAAHNYPQHFGRLKTLTPGALIQFTDMEGRVYTYSLDTLETVSPDSEDQVLGGTWDLVLYTCTPGGQMRVMAGANRQ